MAVAAADQAALALGIRPAMALTHARAMVPGLAVVDADPEGDAAALARLAAWCLRYAPLTAADPPDGCGSTSPAAPICTAARQRCARTCWSVSPAAGCMPARRSPTRPAPPTRWHGSGRRQRPWSPPHFRRSPLRDSSLRGSIPHLHKIAVYALPWSSPSTPQHSLSGGRYPLSEPDFHRLDHARFLVLLAHCIPNTPLFQWVDIVFRNRGKTPGGAVHQAGWLRQRMSSGKADTAGASVAPRRAPR